MDLRHQLRLAEPGANTDRNSAINHYGVNFNTILWLSPRICIRPGNIEVLSSQSICLCSTWLPSRKTFSTSF